MTEAEKQVWRSAYATAYATAQSSVAPHFEALRVAMGAVESLRRHMQFEPHTDGDRMMREAME